jgi:glycosyltransferase involved in cell wall biosynthesis
MFPLWGNGSGAWLRRLTNQLAEQYPNDFEAAIVAPDKHKLPHAKLYQLDPPHKGVFVGNPELPGVKKFADFTSMELIQTYNYYFLEGAKAIEKFKPDIIHVFHTAFLPPIARNLANFYKIPFIFTTHGSDLYYFKEDNRWKSLMHAASQKATFITANSQFTKDWYVQLFGREFTRKTIVIPSGIDNKVNFEKDVSWIDKKYKFKHKHMVLFTGRLIDHKGVGYLIMAAKKIQAEIVILGDGPERSNLEKLVKSEKLDNVHILGFFSDRFGKIQDFYLRADVYVAPSTWKEPLGLVILEAMVSKTPVIVTMGGGVKTIVKDGENGFLIRAKDSNVIAAKVNMLLADDKLRKKIADNAFKTVVTRFNWDKIAARFYNLYTRAIVKKK